MAHLAGRAGGPLELLGCDAARPSEVVDVVVPRSSRVALKVLRLGVEGRYFRYRLASAELV